MIHRLVNTVALAAAGIVLAAGLWNGWSLLATGRRLVGAYLGFFFLGSLLALAVRFVPLFEPKAPEPQPAAPRRKGRERAETPPAEA
ncbi:MAG TPA: hypothetical protein PLQ13_07775 [Candidatus Krumholzibacteria bacterium]|nr:hypothetical protein [Candidatus Krumholzibacteria bacterium]